MISMIDQAKHKMKQESKIMAKYPTSDLLQQQKANEVAIPVGLISKSGQNLSYFMS